METIIKQIEIDSKKAIIQKLVKDNVATVAKQNGAGISCFCCIGC
jgi:hypothetical protein